MNKSIGAMVMIASLLLPGCRQQEKTPQKAVMHSAYRPFGYENSGGWWPLSALQLVWAMSKAFAGPKKVLYGVTFMSIQTEQGQSRTLYQIWTDLTKQITRRDQRNRMPFWINGGKQIAFRCGKGKSQIWVMDVVPIGRR